MSIQLIDKLLVTINLFQLVLTLFSLKKKKTTWGHIMSQKASTYRWTQEQTQWTKPADI